VKLPVDAEQSPDVMLMLCEPALKPLTVNGLLLYDTAVPPSTLYVPVDDVPVPDKLTVTLPLDPPKQLTPVLSVMLATTAQPFKDMF
jgi:hypothetical protein